MAAFRSYPNLDPGPSKLVKPEPSSLVNTQKVHVLAERIRSLTMGANGSDPEIPWSFRTSMFDACQRRDRDAVTCNVDNIS